MSAADVSDSDHDGEFDNEEEHYSNYRRSPKRDRDEGMDDETYRLLQERNEKWHARNMVRSMGFKCDDDADPYKLVPSLRKDPFAETKSTWNKLMQYRMKELLGEEKHSELISPEMMTIVDEVADLMMRMPVEMKPVQDKDKSWGIFVKMIKEIVDEIMRIIIWERKLDGWSVRISGIGDKIHVATTFKDAPMEWLAKRIKDQIHPTIVQHKIQFCIIAELYVVADPALTGMQHVEHVLSSRLADVRQTWPDIGHGNLRSFLSHFITNWLSLSKKGFHVAVTPHSLWELQGLRMDMSPLPQSTKLEIATAILRYKPPSQRNRPFFVIPPTYTTARVFDRGDLARNEWLPAGTDIKDLRMATKRKASVEEGWVVSMNKPGLHGVFIDCFGRMRNKGSIKCKPSATVSAWALLEKDHIHLIAKSLGHPCGFALASLKKEDAAKLNIRDDRLVQIEVTEIFIDREFNDFRAEGIKYCHKDAHVSKKQRMCELHSTEFKPETDMEKAIVSHMEGLKGGRKPRGYPVIPAFIESYENISFVEWVAIRENKHFCSNIYASILLLEALKDK